MNTTCYALNASMFQCTHYTVDFPNMVSVKIRYYHSALLWINPTRCQKQTVGVEAAVVRSLMLLQQVVEILEVMIWILLKQILAKFNLKLICQLNIRLVPPYIKYLSALPEPLHVISALRPRQKCGLMPELSYWGPFLLSDYDCNIAKLC